MIRKALRFAIGPSIGVVAGSFVFRLTNRSLYGESWPPMLAQVALYLILSYAACFLVILLIEWIKSKLANH
jgi:hypothetical protein